MLTEFVEMINKSKFLPEFTYMEQKVSISGGELELSDCAIWFDDKVALYQLKERKDTSIGDLSTEQNWFINKIEGLAKKQIKKSIQFFTSQENIEIKNVRGHTFNIKKSKVAKIYKIVIYKHQSFIALGLKKYVSSDIGFIHIFDYEDYKLICDILDTPTEIFEYLEFREQVLNYKKALHPLTEKNILGIFVQFSSFNDFLANLSESSYDAIILDFEDNIDKLIKNQGEYDIGYILESFSDRLYTSSGIPTSYYKILVEITKLNRTERKSFKERWEKCSKHVMGKDNFMLPYRIVASSSKCGFIFIPILSTKFDKRRQIMTNLINLSKYELKLSKHIGIIFCRHDNYVYVDYSYIEYEWIYNKDFETATEKIKPFRPLKVRSIPRYQFTEESK